MSVIRFNAVSKSYPGAHGGPPVTAIDDLSFAIDAGEYVTILGRSGCGKSTTLALTLGLIGASGGSITTLGVDPHRAFDALRGKIGCIFQDDRLLPWRNARDNVALPLELAGVAQRAREERADHWLSVLGLANFTQALPHQLSGGMRQRVAIARALAAEPDLLLADEAFSRLDAVIGRELRIELRRIAKATGKTVLHITHAIDEALDVSDRILVFAHPGRCLADLPGVIDASEALREQTRGTILALLEEAKTLVVAAE